MLMYLNAVQTYAAQRSIGQLPHRIHATLQETASRGGKKETAD